VRPLPIPHIHYWRKMEACLINFNKGKDDEGCLNILQYSEMECNCVRKITEGLFRKYSTLWQHKCESLITVKNIIHLGQRPPKVWGPRLQPIEPIGKSGTVGYPLWSTVKLFVLYSVGLCHGKRFRCDVYVCSKIGYHGQVLRQVLSLAWPRDHHFTQRRGLGL
jgi:hypothetical protein